MKAIELIRDSLQEIGKQASEQEIKGDQFQTAKRYLNRMMSSKSYLGLDYTQVDDSSDEITTQEYAWEWMVKGLAVRLAPQFGQLESYAALKSDEEEAYATVLLSIQGIGAPQFSGNVPLGSGNRRTGQWTPRFYTENDDGLLTETNQDIIAEDGTEAP